MATALNSNKTKIAKRVVEVFEFFSTVNRRATVMDIVRRYGRPQSSTSELLCSLVEIGLLYKDPQSRTYAPTPRLAALGFAAQPDPIRSGRLFGYMDALAQTTRCSVGLFGMVGTHAQIFRVSPGGSAPDEDLECGASELLSAGVIGRLLLSSLGVNQANRILWRLNAEAPERERFDLAAATRDVAKLCHQGHVAGPSGFGNELDATAVMLPDDLGERGLVLAALYPASASIDRTALLATLQHGAENLGREAADIAVPLLRELATA
ncbi:helix-turn-helix domain-containing protein [Novosphingobium malaysiense]|uniref:helix-turn-helix domain-containing protein n=1 Tax=Novosphingobium malaysiense TaxID=1348853 RepID=UPI00068BA125|nr:helix-turn-helix domain-containing protein [Novosphingobium malaysiense]